MLIAVILYVKSYFYIPGRITCSVQLSCYVFPPPLLLLVDGVPDYSAREGNMGKIVGSDEGIGKKCLSSCTVLMAVSLFGRAGCTKDQIAEVQTKLQNCLA